MRFLKVHFVLFSLLLLALAVRVGRAEVDVDAKKRLSRCRTEIERMCPGLPESSQFLGFCMRLHALELHSLCSRPASYTDAAERAFYEPAPNPDRHHSALVPAPDATDVSYFRTGLSDSLVYRLAEPFPPLKAIAMIKRDLVQKRWMLLSEEGKESSWPTASGRDRLGQYWQSMWKNEKGQMLTCSLVAWQQYPGGIPKAITDGTTPPALGPVHFIGSITPVRRHFDGGPAIFGGREINPD